MIVWHGFSIEVSKPDILSFRKNLDFGVGFYVTPLYGQARKWSEKFTHIKLHSIISKYILSDDVFLHSKVLKFDIYSKEWVDCIVSCRRGNDMMQYDIII